jgi:hypothetical protein
MSFGCQLKLRRKAESERLLGLVEIDDFLVGTKDSIHLRYNRAR